MAFSNVATVGFVGTNYNKVSTGDWTRTPVLGAQVVNAMKAGSQLTQVTADYAKTVSNAVTEAAKSSKVFNAVAKTVDFASKNVNTLIGASCLVKVATAKEGERTQTALTQGGCFAGMLLGEGWMKRGNLEKILNHLPIEKKWANVVKGILFVAGSLTSSAIGEYAGGKLAQGVDKKPKSVNVKA